ncbi:MAG TPA: DUF1007 family protein [Treponemataceae bacterium]|nr:DUF1007 family protein [Treponemataceae bacterium]
MLLKKQISIAKFFLAVNMLFILPATLFAHPHVFIKTSIEFVFEEKKLMGAWESWEFDRFFSAEIISWLDTDQDGDFNETESNMVYNNAFINLKNYYFYTFIRQGNTRTTPQEVLHFRARAKDGIMTYTFYIDLSHYKGNNVCFAVYDYTYFCDVEYLKPIKITYNNTAINPKYVIQENKNHPVYYDPLGAVNDTTIYYKPAPGLQTYYPKEIHLSW